MSHAFYSSGDKDEDGNYQIPKTWGDDPFHFKPTIIQLEKCTVDNIQIDLDFIKKKCNSDNTSEKFRWIRISQYAYAVNSFYWSAISMFYKHFCNKEVANAPIKKITWASLYACAKKLEYIERDIIQKTYLHDKKSLESFINNYVKIKRITEYGNIAWLMYHTLVNEIKNQHITEDMASTTKIVTNSISYKNAIDEVDENDYTKLLILFRNAKLVQRHIKQTIDPSFVANKHGYVFYKDYNSQAEMDKLIEIVGGVKISDMGHTLVDIKEKLSKFYNQHPVIERMVKFYDAYYKMKENINILNETAYNYNNNIVSSNIVVYLDSRDVGHCYPLVLSYKSASESLLEQLQGEDEVFINDVKVLLDKINKCLASSEELYIKWKEEDEKATAELKKRFGNKND